MKVYENMRGDIVPHPAGLTVGNAHELGSMNFVFMAVDPGEHKKLVIAAMQQSGVPFVDLYNDLEHEHQCTYAVDGNSILIEECQ